MFVNSERWLLWSLLQLLNPSTVNPQQAPCRGEKKKRTEEEKKKRRRKTEKEEERRGQRRRVDREKKKGERRGKEMLVRRTKEIKGEEEKRKRHGKKVTPKAGVKVSARVTCLSVCFGSRCKHIFAGRTASESDTLDGSFPATEESTSSTTLVRI